jgi:hypothetical protein
VTYALIHEAEVARHTPGRQERFTQLQQPPADSLSDVGRGQVDAEQLSSSFDEPNVAETDDLCLIDGDQEGCLTALDFRNQAPQTFRRIVCVDIVIDDLRAEKVGVGVMPRCTRDGLHGLGV